MLFLGATLSVCMLLLTGLKVSKEDLQKILDGNPAPGPRHCHQHWGHARQSTVEGVRISSLKQLLEACNDLCPG